MPAMLRSERDRRIVRILRSEGSASAAGLADRLAVSRATIRRDLERLERAGTLRRVYGGAIVPSDHDPDNLHDVRDADRDEPNGQVGAEHRAVGRLAADQTSEHRPAGYRTSRHRASSTQTSEQWRSHQWAGPTTYGEEEPFAAVSDTDAEAKERVAAAAATLVQDGDVLLLDIGTTVFRLARHLHGRAVTVLTSNMAVFDELRDDPEVQLVLLGGVYRPNYRTLVGSLTESVLGQVSAEWLFLSCTGVRADGQVVDDIQAEASVKRAMIAAAESVVLLAHHGKFPGRGPWRVCGLDEVDTVITTEATEQQWLSEYEQTNGKVMIA